MYSSVSELTRQDANKKTGAKALFYSPSTNKTYAKKKTKDCIYFASTLEYLIYRELVKMAGIQRVKTQVPLLIKNATERYPVKTWRCDLRIYNPYGDYVNIECKGELTAEFKLMLQFLEKESPNQYDLLVVVANRKPCRIDKNLSTCTWDTLKTFLLKHGYKTADIPVDSFEFNWLV